MLLETIGSALEKDPNSPLSAQKEDVGTIWRAETA